MKRRYFCKLAAAAAASAALPASGPALPFTASSSRPGNLPNDSAHATTDALPGPVDSLWSAFQSPPDSAKPYVLWMWMGSNVTRSGITSNLEAMSESGIGGATIYSLADTLTPWACEILRSPTPDIVAFTDPWWEMIRHAALEAKRLGLELIIHNCAGYESSGGTWITPELSMQELVWSETRVASGKHFAGALSHPAVNPYPTDPFPEVYIPSEGKVGIPKVEAKETFLRDIAVIAAPASGDIDFSSILDLSRLMKPDGTFHWDAPAGEWIVYRFGHTTTGAMVQPAQWKAMGLECDKMSVEAVTFHVEHVLHDMRKHLGDLMGTTVTTLYFDSYEAGTPSWTPKMREEFHRRRGYDPVPWLAAMAGRTVDSDARTLRFKADLTQTIHDLYRDVYWATPGPLAHAAGMKFAAEPYSGPWTIGEVVKSLDVPTVEFWTHHGRFSPSSLAPVVEAAHRDGLPLIAAESFTSAPQESRWKATPAWLKPIGDAAFCAGVQRINLHNFVHQPWDERYQPGNAMGQWGIHFGRYQTWWKPGRAWLRYLWRCQSLLQRGEYVSHQEGPAVTISAPSGKLEIQSIHRREGAADFFFVANVSDAAGKVSCAFPVIGAQPELWDPLDVSRHETPEFTAQEASTLIPLDFAPGQSYFLIFNPQRSTAPEKRRRLGTATTITELTGPWTVAFDPRWGGPTSTVFNTLVDWTTHTVTGIRYYSGTALYRMEVTVPEIDSERRIYLDLGAVKHIAEVAVNGVNVGVVWTAPWRIDITTAIRKGKNFIEIAVSNVWANRLIGDEQQPADFVWELGDPNMRGGYYMKAFPEWFLQGHPRPSSGRYTFTTWNYFAKDSPLEPSGLLGPVKITSL